MELSTYKVTTFDQYLLQCLTKRLNSFNIANNVRFAANVKIASNVSVYLPAKIQRIIHKILCYKFSAD